MSVNLSFDIFARENVSDTLDTIGDELGNAGENLDKFAAGAAVAGAAAGAALIAGVMAGMEQERLEDKFAAQMGATGQYAEDLGRIAGDLYAGAYGDSLEEVQQGLRGVLTNGLVDEDAADEEISGLTAKVMDFATAFEQDLGGATAAVGQMLRTGLAPDAETALDILTRGMQQGGDKAQDLLDTFNEYGGQFQKFGLDGATATGLITQGLQAGARDADLVADSIKEFSIRAIDGSEGTKAGFDAIGLSASDMAAKIAAGGPTASAALDQTLDALRGIEDPIARNAAAVALFGTQAEDMGDALYALDPSSAVAALGTVEGATTQLGQTLNDNAATNLESFKRQAKQTFVDMIGGSVLPKVNELASFLSTNLGPAVESVTAFYKDNKTVIDTVAIGAGTIIGLVITWTGVMKAYAAVQALVNVVMAANPIGIIILLIAGLVAGLIYAYNHSETFRRIVQGAFEAVGKAASWIGDQFQLLWAGAKAVFGALRDWVQARIFDLIQVAGRIIEFRNKIVTGITEAKDRAIALASGLVSWFTSLPGKLTSAVSGMWDGLWTTFKSAANRVIRAWNDFKLEIGGGTVLGVSIPKVTLNTPNLPLLATGGTATAAGWSIVGERGPELRYLPTGASIVPLQPQVRDAALAGAGGPLVHIDNYHSAGEHPDAIAGGLLMLLRSR